MILRTDDVGKQIRSAAIVDLRRISVTRPMEIPATGVFTGTPASMSASMPRTPLAIDVDPLIP